MARWRPPWWFLRQTMEVIGGLLAANIGDVFNISIMALAIAYLNTHPETLAVLPGLAALRGSIYTSLSSRVSTNLHLGVYKAEYRDVVEKEWANGVVLSFSSAILVGFLAGFLSGLSVSVTITVSIISTALSWMILMPGTAVLGVSFYRRNVDPDKVSAPVITVLGDAVTIPSLVAASIMATHITHYPLAVTGLISIFILAVTVVLTLKKETRVTFIQTMSSLIIVAIIESITGAILAKWGASKLNKEKLLPVYPSFLEDVGAVAAVVAAKTSTMSYLGTTGDKPYKFSLEELILFIQSHIAIFPAMTIITLINHVYTGAPLTESLLAIYTAALTVAFLGSLLSNILVKATFRQEIDPDNVILPLTTSITDLLGTIVLPLIAVIL